MRQKALWQAPIGIVHSPVIGSQQTVEEHRFCFPTGRITVHFAALHTAVGAQKEIGPSNAMPTALGRKPHEFLIGGEAKIVVQPGRMVPHQGDEFLIHGSHTFGSASQGFSLGSR